MDLSYLVIRRFVRRIGDLNSANCGLFLFSLAFFDKHQIDVAKQACLTLTILVIE